MHRRQMLGVGAALLACQAARPLAAVAAVSKPSIAGLEVAWDASKLLSIMIDRPDKTVRACFSVAGSAEQLRAFGQMFKVDAEYIEHLAQQAAKSPTGCHSLHLLMHDQESMESAIAQLAEAGVWVTGNQGEMTAIAIRQVLENRKERTC